MKNVSKNGPKRKPKAGGPTDKRKLNPGKAENLRPAWKPGTSGNPAGTPLWLREMRGLAAKAAPEAFERLVSMMRDTTEPRIALEATCELLDRAGLKGFAYEPQKISIEDENGTSGDAVMGAILGALATFDERLRSSRGVKELDASSTPGTRASDAVVAVTGSADSGNGVPS